MQLGFKHELNAVTAGHKAGRRGPPLTNFTRATNIAQSSRTIAKLDVGNRVQASQLARLGGYTKFLGNGLAVIDFASRVGQIKTSYEANVKWERELFIESSSFAASAIAGTVAVKAGLAILMVATPIGWVGLIIGGVAVAGAAAGSSLIANNLVKGNSGSFYDALMDWLN